jgi:hypothetical protein
LLWVFVSLFEHIKRRGRREKPLAITIDEFSAMAFKVTEGTNPLAQMLDEFIQQYLRGQNIWLTIAHQSVNQIDEQIRNSLFSLGTYMFGRAATMPEARLLADLLYRTSPHKVKYWHRVWASEPVIGQTRIIGTNHFVIDHRPEFMPLDEQQEEAAQRLFELSLFEFLCRPAIREGEVSKEVIPISIASIDRDEETGEYQFPNAERVARLRRALESQAGIPATSILKELDTTPPGQRAAQENRHARLQEPPQQSGETPASQPAHRHQQRRRQISSE